MGTASSTEKEPPTPPRSLPDETTHQKDAKAEDSEGGGCPMHRSDGTYSWDPRAMWRAGFPHGPGGSKPLQTDGDDGVKKPEYNVYAQEINKINSQNNMPSQPNQLPAASQSEALSTERISSSIPKGGGAGDGSTWTYPSPQMFYNSLDRKNKLDGTSEKDMDSVVAVHNHMNELTWKQVVEWERVIADNDSPKLLKFQGRPHDLSPKAYIKHYLLGHTLPFDRHDWYVERPDGSVVRYVLDYYSATNEDLVVDVRPALDSPSTAWQRAVSMPSAQAAGTTPYTPLPLAPRPELRGTTAPVLVEPITTEKKAFRATSMVLECKAEQLALEACQTDDCVAKASMDLTLCLARHVCPVQMAALQQQTSDADVEAAFERLAECVARNAGRED